MSNRNFLLFIVVTSVIAVTILTSFSIFFIAPSFSNLIVKNTESEAVKVGQHLSEHFRITGKVSKDLPADFPEAVTLAVANFGLMKIKVFAPDGETVFSTSENDIGQINERDYFHNIVAKGGVHTKLVKKDTKSLEDQVVLTDVVETYVPVMNAGNFTGAFEIYYDITDNLNELDDLLFRVHSLLLIIAAGLILALLVISFIAKQSILKQELAEAERKELIVKLQRALNEIKTYQAKLKEMALFDPLTNLPNRRFFIYRLNMTLEYNRRYNGMFGVLYLDLDNFKKVNDTLGHQAGDELLCEVTKLLKKVIRESDTFARLGGDEFVIIIDQLTSAKEAGIVAEKLIAAIAKTIQLKTGSAKVGASIGISLFPSDSDEAEELLQQSDKSMYISKSQGRNTYTFYSEVAER
jgi:diguanylate cyclase (GGDEF)-like protein